jgi:hypothetical protein
MPGRFSFLRWALYTRCDAGLGRSAQAKELKEPRLILMMNQDVKPREMAVLPSAEKDCGLSIHAGRCGFEVLDPERSGCRFNNIFLALTG